MSLIAPYVERIAEAAQGIQAAKTAIASAITAKGGTVGASDGLADFSSAIAAIPSGGSAARTNKYRPPDWPDFDSLQNLPNQSMAFFTFDTQICDPADLVCNIIWTDYSARNTVRIDRGTIQNGQFVANQTWQNLPWGGSTVGNEFDRQIPTDEGRYVCYRIWNPDTSTANKIWASVGDYTDLAGCPRKKSCSPIVDEYFWKCGISAQPVGGYANCTVYTQMQTMKGCYVPTGTSLYYNNETVIPRHAEFDGILNDTFSWYLPFDCDSNMESVAFRNFTMDNTNSYGGLFNGCSRLTDLVFDNVTVKTVSLNNCFSGCSSLRELNLRGWNTSSVTNASQCFYGCSSLTALDIGYWDLGSVTNTSNMFAGCSELRELSCEGTILPSVSISMSACANLTDESLANIANALPYADATITLHATPKARLAEIVGNVYSGVFFPAEGGQITLEDYIALTKGWTIA